MALRYKHGVFGGDGGEEMKANLLQLAALLALFGVAVLVALLTK